MTQTSKEIVHDIVRGTSQSEMIENRRKRTTRQQYGSRIRRMVRIIKSGFPDINDLIDNENWLKRHIPTDVMQHLITEFNERGVDSFSTYVSSSAFGGFVSTFKYWHEMSDEKRPRDSPRIELPKEHEEYLQKFSEGRKRKIAELRNDGLLSSKEGKSYLLCSAYKWLAKTAAKDSGHHYAQPFLVLSWNLMARSQTTSTLLWKNVGWDGDCMTLQYDTSKSNQTGENVVPRHLYANPFEPSICPVLAMGIKLLSESHTKPSPAMLFPGGSANKNFCTWLYQLIKNPQSGFDLSNLGSNPDDIGTHSIRKGAATYVCGLTEGPQSDTIKLRMDHTLGKVDDMYLYIQSGADKLVGRCASGLNMNTLDFNVLPPLFVDMDEVNFDDVLPAGNIKTASESLGLAVPFLIASVVYHWDWICENLPWNHKIFSSRFASGNFGKLWASKVKLFVGECPNTHLTASGILRTSQLAFGLHDMSIKMASGFEIIKKLMINMESNVIKGVVKNIASVDGVAVTNEEMTKRVCKEEMAPIFAQMKIMNDNLLKYQLGPSSIPDRELITATSFDQGAYRSFRWGGRFHNVPEGFMVPQDTPMALWRFWIYGDLSKKIGPFRFIQGYSLSRSQQTQFSKLKKVMETTVSSMNMPYDELTAMDHQRCEALFFEHYALVVGEISNIDRIKTSTAYDNIRKIRLSNGPTESVGTPTEPPSKKAKRSSK